MQFFAASMSAIMTLTKHGAMISTHTPCLVIANMADIEALQIALVPPFPIHVFFYKKKVYKNMRLKSSKC